MCDDDDDDGAGGRMQGHSPIHSLSVQRSNGSIESLAVCVCVIVRLMMMLSSTTEALLVAVCPDSKRLIITVTVVGQLGGLNYTHELNITQKSVRNVERNAFKVHTSSPA
jgi:hypothetical protein